MPAEPAVKRAVAFFDGQNLFYAAKYAFGYNWPNYDPLKLAGIVCQKQGWQLQKFMKVLKTGWSKSDVFTAS
ncbi:MAG TPA: hypothetical protein VJ783_08370 [Pirellulales bacterium]|nr:hypothetical protein [Pirellulales bacterium]